MEEKKKELTKPLALRYGAHGSWRSLSPPSPTTYKFSQLTAIPVSVGGGHTVGGEEHFGWSRELLVIHHSDRFK